MEKTWKPIVAGILCIIAGSIGVIIGIVVAAVGGIGWLFAMPWFSAIAAPIIVVGIIAIVGGVHALRREFWGLALAGAICAVLGPWAILGILAIIFVSLGKGEFK
jgi:hypothetical protein